MYLYIWFILCLKVSRSASPSQLTNMLRRKVRISRLSMPPQQIMQIWNLIQQGPEKVTTTVLLCIIVNKHACRRCMLLKNVLVRWVFIVLVRWVFIVESAVRTDVMCCFDCYKISYVVVTVHLTSFVSGGRSVRWVPLRRTEKRNRSETHKIDLLIRLLLAYHSHIDSENNDWLIQFVIMVVYSCD